MDNRSCVIELPLDEEIPKSGIVAQHRKKKVKSRSGKANKNHQVPSHNGPTSLAASDTQNRDYVENANENFTTAHGDAAVVWYLEESSKPSNFKCTKSITDLKPGLYRPVIGISSKNIDLEYLESIIFQIDVESPEYVHLCRYTEIIQPYQLKAMFSGNGVCRWKLHWQFDCSELGEPARPLQVKMEIRYGTGRAPTPTRGVLWLHYFELHDSLAEGNTQGAPIHIHKPYTWSIDVDHTVTPTDPGPAHSVKIINYSVSGDGMYAATLSSTDHQLYLDLWDLSRSINDTSTTVNLEGCDKKIPYYPRRSIRKPLPLSGSSKQEHGKAALANAVLSVSWSGTYVALILKAAKSLENQLVIYKRSITQELTELADILAKLTPTTNLQNNLCDFYGQGQFHVTSIKDPQEKNELFITCDRTSIWIYSVHNKWSLLREIPHGVEVLQSTTINLQGRFLAWFRDDGQLFIWDLEADALATLITGPKTSAKRSVTFSCDGMMIAVSHDNSITTYWTECGASVGSFNLDPSNCVSGLIFTQEDSKLLVNWGKVDWGIDNPTGYILDTATMSYLGEFSLPGRYSRAHQRNDASSQGLYSCHGSTLNLVRLEDYVFDPISPVTCNCDYDRNPRDFDDVPSYDEPSQDQTFEFKSPTGLIFSYWWRALAKSDPCAFFLAVSQHDFKRELIRIPPIALAGEWAYKCIYRYAQYFADRSVLLLYSDDFIMVLSLPTTYNGECNILKTHWIQKQSFRHDNDYPLNLREEIGLVYCKHQLQLMFVLFREKSEIGGNDRIMVQISLDGVFSADQGFQFVNGIMVMIEMYKDAEDSCRKAIVRYLGLHINTYMDPTKKLDSVIGTIIDAWEPQSHDAIVELLGSLLTANNIRWVPRPDYSQDDNPILVLLGKACSKPLIMELARVMIKYCLRKAKEERDSHFISPITACLPELCNKDKPHSVLSLDSLRKMAYIPVKQRSHIIDNHIISYPPRPRWKFWKPNQRALGKCENPILRYNYSSKPHNTEDDSFVNDIFVAPFSMLWHVQESTATLDFATSRHSTWLAKTWLLRLASMTWYTFSPKSPVYVTCHGFSLEELSNPAISALIEYKWNTLGFKYWLLRFLFQCVYYLLVLVVVYKQVYSDQQPAIILFIVIMTFSGIFLWLEFMQLFRNRSRYITSPYNILDILVFGLPLVAGVSQIVTSEERADNGTNAALSFSVLLVFLHMLFELRTNSSVCHFVTIIVQVIGQIRVFFLIFAGGIVAFSIAILHLLRGCSAESCEQTTEFPKNPFYALSATYFFMGGIYDPVSDHFKEESWTFHLMMMVYLLFTVILMLNVLIALINTAFNAGDEAWTMVYLENRLRYIESAENMAYYIADFKRLQKYFSAEVYYTATPQEIVAYKNKFRDRLKVVNEGQDIRNQLLGISSEFYKIKSLLTLCVSAITGHPLDSTSKTRNNNWRDFDPDALVDNDGFEELSAMIINRSLNAEGGRGSQALENSVEQLRSQLSEAQSRMDKQVGDLQGELHQIKDLLIKLVSSKTEE